MKTLRRIAVLAKENAPAWSLARKFDELFREMKADVRFDEMTARALRRDSGFPRARIPADRRLVISLGGDGTLLEAARAAPNGAQLLGVNIGTLGFLTGVSRGDSRAVLRKALTGGFDRDVRRFLEIRVTAPRGGQRRHYVLNDAVLSRGTLSRIAKFTLRFDGRPLTTLRADGIVLSSPTGSTAYNLSAGGPLLHPEVSAYLVTPICPHALTHRPLVLPAGKTLEVSAEAGSPEGIYLTLDGQQGFRLPSGAVLRARGARRTVTLLRRPGSDYFITLSEKLNWGA
jgi:NAD+ kinase